jgi:hypothetical protein
MNEIKWANYWRNSLADADSGQGILTKKDLEKGYLKVPRDILKTGKVDLDILAQLFNDVDKDMDHIKVSYRPRVKARKLNHGKPNNKHFPEYFTALICPLWLTREGLLFPAEMVIVPRDLLSPQDSGKLALNDTDTLDKFLTTSSLQTIDEGDLPTKATKGELLQQSKCWTIYIEYCRDLYTEVCLDVDAKLVDDYEEPIYSLMIKSTQLTGVSNKILALYDDIITSKTELPLFSNYATRQIAAFENCITPNNSVALRCGHSSNLYALADAQRDALTHALDMEDGDVLAVNGPPGTGKTTYVLSVVASLWIDAAIQKSNPPVIFAASTNNQAVTNVIDAFGKDFSEGEGPLSGRWLPDIKSYGAYFPSFSKQAEAQKKFQTSVFFDEVENLDYLDIAESFFLEKSKEITDVDAIESVREWLHDELCRYQLQLKNIEVLWPELCNARAVVLAELGETPELTLDGMEEAHQASELLSRELSKDAQRCLTFLASESIWLNLFSWLTPVRKKRALNRRLYFSSNLSQASLDLLNGLATDDIESELMAYKADVDKQTQDLLEQYTHKKQFFTQWQRCEKNWADVCENIELPIGDISDFDTVDKQADTKIRFVMFRLAVHYWEASWLIETRNLDKSLSDLKNKKGKSVVMPRWQRRMMLTPCMVSTFHSLPNLMTCSTYDGTDFGLEYLFNFIDLLIVDEGGQVSPEVAGASFALAKKALVIGDIHQIEPVRSITTAIDLENLTQQGLVVDQAGYENIEKHGRSVINGSVMKIAQSASRFHYQPQNEAGMYLTEHRRCYDEIINFCNVLCYKGTLKPMRGEMASNALFPAFGYLHIDSKAEQKVGGSWFNSNDAQTIAHWLAENREKLEGLYQDKLENIVGIVTPFKAQVDEIESFCKQSAIKVGKNNNELTVGTVHALQGAERKLVIFSPVYTRHNDGGFINSAPSMLNVAVSRAKDSFLVFGDMNVISKSISSSPLGILGQFLFKKDSNELVFADNNNVNKMDVDIDVDIDIKQLHDAKAHDQHLVELLKVAKKQIVVVSPWVQLRTLESTGLLDIIKDAIGRNVNVSLYTDKSFNTCINNKLDTSKASQFKSCCETLEKLGVNIGIINGIHSKMLMVDDIYMTTGSYNWFSAAREGIYANMESSTALKGKLKTKIETELRYLNQRMG